MKNLITVTEKINRNGDNSIYSYSYHAPTHWSSDGIVRVYCQNHGGRLRYGSGGTNSDFSDVLIADVMRQAFTMAQKRLVELDQKELDAL